MHPNQKADLRELQDHGVKTSKTNKIEYNAGSETHRHAQAKATVGYLGLQNGYRVDSEVSVPDGSIDVLLWGNRDRLTLAVECETSPTEEVIESKLQRYVRDVGPIDDMFVLNLNEMPENRLDALEWAREQLGLEP